MPMKKKMGLLILILSTSILTSSLAASYAIEQSYDDITKDDWFYAAVQVCSEGRFMQGTGEGVFRPHDFITYQQGIILAARLHQYYYAQPEISVGNDWFEPYYEYSLQHKLVVEQEFFPDALMNREIFAGFIARATPVEQLEKINEIESIPGYLASSDFASAVQLLYSAGVLTGIDGKGTFSGYSPITRAEVAAILSRVIEPSMRLTFSALNQPSPQPMKLDLDHSGIELIGFDGFYIYASKIAEKEGLTPEISVFDLNGKQLVPWINGSIYEASDGLFLIIDENGHYFFYNEYGEKLNETPLYFATRFHEGYAVIKEEENGDIFLVDKMFNTIKQFANNIYWFSHVSSGYFQVESDDGRYLYHIESDEMIEMPYDEISSFLDGIARVRKTTEAGPWANLIDENRTLLFERSYAYIGSGGQYWPVTDDMVHYGVADASGRLVVPMTFSSIEAGGDGMALFKQDGITTLNHMATGDVTLVFPCPVKIFSNYLIVYNEESNTNIVINYAGESIAIIHQADKSTWYAPTSLLYSDMKSLYLLQVQ